ncbi:MAG: peptidoglycan DD-metalloendopeptidase family protein [Dehalococcoidia bacterium]|nr:peptidoglycan DD-metalloendopeptidase family protein [Dehalococcoidia bacterium]
MTDTPSDRPRPWHARPEFRIAALVTAVLLLTGAVAWSTQRGGGDGLGDLVVAAAGTAAPVPTSTPSGTADDPISSTDTPSPSPTTEASPGASASATASATPIPTSTSSAVETATATVEPAPAIDVRLQPEAAGLGETAIVRAQIAGASSLTLRFQGQAYPMMANGDGSFWAIVGVPLNAATGQDTLTVTARDAAGTPVAERALLYDVVPVERPVDQLQLTEEEGSVLTPEAGALELQLRSQQFTQFDPGRRWDGLMRQPVAGVMTTQFGQGRSINGGPVGGFHTGTDLANELGTPVAAAAPGRVSWAGEMPIRGNAVIIDHGAGVKTGYHHLDSIVVEVGQSVGAGDIIGLMGSTGLSTGPHLHWELTIYGVNVDPMTWTKVDFAP